MAPAAGRAGPPAAVTGGVVTGISVPSHIAGGGAMPPNIARPALATQPLPSIEASTPQVLFGKQHAFTAIPKMGGMGGQSVATAGLAMHVAPDIVPQTPMAGSAQQGAGNARPPGRAAPPGIAMPVQVVIPHATLVGAAAAAPAAALTAPAVGARPAVDAGVWMTGVSVVAGALLQP